MTRDGTAVKIPYRARWGHERTHFLKSHPKRAARRLRAAERQAEESKRSPTDARRKAVRLGLAKRAA